MLNRDKMTILINTFFLKGWLTFFSKNLKTETGFLKTKQGLDHSGKRFFIEILIICTYRKIRKNSDFSTDLLNYNL